MQPERLAIWRKILMAELEFFSKFGAIYNVPKSEARARRRLDKMNILSLRWLEQAMRRTRRAGRSGKSAVPIDRHPRQARNNRDGPRMESSATRRPSRRRKSVQSLRGS